jgi:hypothetical protein
MGAFCKTKLNTSLQRGEIPFLVSKIPKIRKAGKLLDAA